MKYILIVILFLITDSKGMAQSKKQKVQFMSDSGLIKMAATIQSGSDTLEISEPLQIHFIKIGNEVYQINPHPTTIDKVPPPPVQGTLRLGGWYNTLNSGIVPVGGGSGTTK